MTFPHLMHNRTSPYCWPIDLAACLAPLADSRKRAHLEAAGCRRHGINAAGARRWRDTGTPRESGLVDTRGDQVSQSLSSECYQAPRSLSSV